MSSYVITGVSRGIGYELLRQYSADSDNTVIGIVRNKPATETKISDDADLKERSNIHIVQADLVNYETLKKSADAVAQVTGGSLDYLIANAAHATTFDAYAPLGELAEDPDELTKQMRDLFDTNVISNIHLFKLFMPLILKGRAKKVIAISSGMADTEVVRGIDLAVSPLYATSKAALNMVVAKYSAQYKEEGVLFLALCPGLVDVGHFNNATPEQLQVMQGTMKKFVAYAPHFKGPATPEYSVAAMRSVISNASLEKGNGGDFLSHLGSKRWV